MLVMTLDLSAQAYTSNDNYTGDWSSDSSWQGGSSPGVTYNADSEVLVLGEISSAVDLFFSKGLLTVRDTLVIYGDLGFGNNGDLYVESTGVLIVLGDLNVGNKVDIAAGGTIIVTGLVNFTGSANQGSFVSTETPSQVYIGGYTGKAPVSDDGGTAVFNCDLPEDEEHDYSECNYGLIDDIEGEDIEDYYKDIICGDSVSPKGIFLE